jgi:hypothetical protein
MVEDVERTPVRPKRRRRKALYFTSEKNRFRQSVGKRNANKEGKRNMLNTIVETVKALDFDMMEGDEGAHADDRISESEMKTSSKKTTNKKVSQLNVKHRYCCTYALVCSK